MVAATREERQDAFINPYTGHGTSRDRRRYTTHQTIAVSDLAAIDLRRGNWLAKRIVEALDDDAFRRTYTFELKDKKQADALKRLIRKLGIDKKAKWAGQMERTCGGAALFPVIDGAVGDLSEPLDLDASPRIRRILSIQRLEPRELTPVEWYTDLEDEKFGQPSLYRFQSITGGGGAIRVMAHVHESRLAIYPGEEITREPLPGQRLGWSDSILNSTHEVIEDYGLSWGSAATILQNFAQRVFKFKGLMKLLELRNGEQLISKRVELMDMVASALRGIPIDADDDMVQVAMSVAGLSDLLVQQAQVVAAAADMPMTRLFGMSPKGMNATGEYDDKGWDDRVINRQDDHTDPIEWMIKLNLLAADGPTNGKVPDDFAIAWRPLDNPSEKDDAETRKTTAEADKIYFDMGAPAESILKSRFGGKQYSRETDIDFNEMEQQKQAADELATKQADAAAMAAMGRDAIDTEEAARDGRPRPGAHPDAEGAIRRKQPPEGE